MQSGNPTGSVFGSIQMNSTGVSGEDFGFVPEEPSFEMGFGVFPLAEEGLKELALEDDGVLSSFGRSEDITSTSAGLMPRSSSLVKSLGG